VNKIVYKKVNLEYEKSAKKWDVPYQTWIDLDEMQM